MMKYIHNNYSTKLFSVVLSLAFFSMSLKVNASEVSEIEPIILKSGTVIPLENRSELNSDFVSDGQTVEFTVSRDVTVDGKIVIARGSLAKGQINSFTPKKGLGKGAMMSIDIKSVTAVDGQEIYLTGGDIKEIGENKAGLAWGLGLFVCFLFLLIKGNPAIVQGGYTFDAYTASTVTIEI